MKKNVLGIKIDDIKMDQAIELVASWFDGSKKHWIATPNPEMIVAAQSDSLFRKILNSADLAIPDGVGLKLAGVKNRITGVDLMERLVALAAEKGFTVGFLGGEKGVAELCVERLSRKYPNLKISFAQSGDEVNQMGNVVGSKYYGKKHNTKYIIPDTDLLFVAFGHGKQERWIYQNLPKIPVKLAMGIGGSFDYISGKVPRATKWLRNLGLEWLFRLIIQPWRIKRQLALFRYIWLLTKERN